MNGYKSKNIEAPLMKKLVQSVLGFLLKSGLTSTEIRSILSECLPIASDTDHAPSRRPIESDGVGNGNVSAEVMRIWHRDTRFLDRGAEPRPLQLSRGPNSLVALIRRLDPSGDPLKSVGVMRSVGLIRRLPDGRYVPTAESVKIDHLHPLAIEHIAKSVVRLVATVCKNTDPRRESIPLVERYAYAPDMNRKEAAAFAEFTRNQGMAYLEAVDDWLEQRRVKGKATPKRSAGLSVAAGVHLFAYIDDFGAHRSKEPASKKKVDMNAASRREGGPRKPTSSPAARA